MERSRRAATMQSLLRFMDQLDRLGYVAAGFSLLILGMVIFAHAWYVFLLRPVQVGLLPAGLKLLNDLLLVIILLELFRTVVRFLQTEVLELAARETRQELFQQYLMDVGLNVTVIIVLIWAVYLLRKRPMPQRPTPA